MEVIAKDLVLFMNTMQLKISNAFEVHVTLSRQIFTNSLK